MPSDTFSSFLGMTLQATGNNNNVWGTILNGSALQVIERAIAGNVSNAVTGGTLDLSGNAPPAGQTQMLDMIQIFNGALTSKQIIVVPNISKTWYIFNDTTGAFPLHIEASGGNPIQIPQGTGKFVVCDGAGNLLRLDRDQVGRFVFCGGSSNPDALACDGSSYLKTDFPDLYAKIGTTFGSVDSLHFTVPLLTDTNRYLRAAGGSLTAGTYQANANKSHTHSVSGSGSTGTESAAHVHTGGGSTSLESAVHNHNYSPPAPFGASGGGFGLQAEAGSGTTGNENQNHFHSFSFTTSGESANHTHAFSFSVTSGAGSADATESRPESLAVYIGILY